MGKIFKTMTADGLSLSDYFQIKKVHRPPTADITNTTKQFGNRGVQLLDKKYGSKLIKVDIFIKDDILDTIDILNSIFGKKEFRISFSDRPDKYFNVTLAGISDPSSDVRDAELTLSFLSMDGQEHSTSYKEVTDYTIFDDRVVFNVENKGNKEAFPIITLKHNEENGYIGFVNEKTLIGLGDDEQADSEPRQHSVIIKNYKESNGTNDINQALVEGAKNVAILNDTSQVLDTTIGVQEHWNRSHLALDYRPTTTGNHAGSLSFDIPEGSLNEYIWWRQVFWAGRASQLGFIKIMVSDENGQFLYGAETIKRKNGLETEYNFFVTDGQGGYIRTDLHWTFNATEKDSDNPFNVPRGWSDMTRRDDQVSVFWWGSQYKRTFPSLKGKKSSKVHIAIGGFGTKELVTHAYLDELVIRKDNVSYEFDIPNTFAKGTVVVMDSERDLVIVDNLEKLNLLIDGFENFPIIPVGKSTFEIYFSSFLKTKPDINFKFEERW